MLGRRRSCVRRLSKVVETAQSQCGLPVRLALEIARFLRAHRSALKRQAFYRILGECVEIFGLCRTEITLGFDMKCDRRGDFRSEYIRQVGKANRFMPVVDASLGEILANIVKHVADVVHEGSCDYLGRFARLLSQMRTLQGVLLLRYVRESIAAFGFGVQQVYDLVYFFAHAEAPIEIIDNSLVIIKVSDTR